MFCSHYFYLFTFFASQSLNTRVSLRATEEKQKKGGRGKSSEQPVREYFSIELKQTLKYSQRLPLTRLCLESPGKKNGLCANFKYNILKIHNKEKEILISASDTTDHNLRWMLSLL